MKNNVNYYENTTTTIESVESVLEDLLLNIRNSLSCDAGTIYLHQDNALQFYIYQNDTLSTKSTTLLHERFRKSALQISEKSELFAVQSFVKSVVISIDDVYNSSSEEFQATKEIDKKVGYESHSILTVPLLNSYTNESIGVIQLINKIDKNGHIIPFSQKDREAIQKLATFSTIVILHTYDYVKTLSQENVELRNSNKSLSEYLQQQSKMAAMGEMIDAIAHQWRQPLSVLSSKISSLHVKNEFQSLSTEVISESLYSMERQIKHMDNTINEFRNFFSVEKYQEETDFETAITQCLHLVSGEFEKLNITIETKMTETELFLAFENEIEHLILNLLNNAKDIFLERKIADAKIKISAYNRDGFSILEVCDNAGGIDNEILKNIFNAHTTTKKNHSGIGLYLSQQIAHKHHTNLEVKNIEDGACFSLRIKHFI